MSEAGRQLCSSIFEPVTKSYDASDRKYPRPRVQRPRDKHVADPARPPNPRRWIKPRIVELAADRGVNDSTDCSEAGDKQNNLPDRHKTSGLTLHGSMNALKQICVGWFSRITAESQNLSNNVGGTVGFIFTLFVIVLSSGLPLLRSVSAVANGNFTPFTSRKSELTCSSSLA